MRPVTALVTGLLAVSALADAPPPTPPMTLHRLNGQIAVDGDLSDSGWQDAAKFDQFYETSPGDNTPAKVKTIAYVTYDDHYFYIGVRCEDPHPEKIRAPYVERDNVIGTDDNIAVFLDTRNDKRTAMELRVNPRGIQGDALFNDANGSEDFSPDFYYDTAAKIDAGGWSAEYRIPFSSLRYSDAPAQTWNILVWRNYPREYRYAFYSSPSPRGTNCLVCHMHPLLGLEGLPKAGHMVAAPYVTAQSLSTPEGGLGSSLGNRDTTKDAGLDVKWTPSQNQAVDLTLNPDFSQVEADVAQITVNQRFAVFFPEKRPFFLEGFDLFDTPLQVAYTRNITDPRWGARATGRAGSSAYTFLVTGNDGGGLTIIPGALGSFFAPEDFKSTDTIGRIRHSIGDSFIGGVLTDREIRGGGHNRVIGPDFQWRPNQSDAVTGELLISSTENPDRPDLSQAWNGERTSAYAFSANWNHQVQSRDYGVSFTDIGKDFRADLGFLPQVGYRDLNGYYGRRWYPQGFTRFVRASLFADEQQDSDGNTIYRRVSPGVTVQGVKNLGAGLIYHVDEQYRVGNRLLGENYAEWFAQIDPSRKISRIGINGIAGQRIDFANGRVGTGATLGPFATLRPIDNLEFDPSVTREWLNVDGGRLYTATVARLKTIYSFSAKSILRVIGQYVTTNSNPALYSFPVERHSGNFLGSVLYSYKLNWQTVLFLGYGDDRQITPLNDLVRVDRTFFFKVSYAIQR
jgi:hypothetical protein